MADNYVAHFKQTTQIGPDDFETITITKVCDRNTTLGEIENWYREHVRSGNCYFGVSQAT